MACFHFLWKLSSRNQWVLWKATRERVAASWHRGGGKSSFFPCLPSTRLQTFLQIFNQVCSLGTRQCWQHRTFVQQIERLMCSPVWMLLNRFFLKSLTYFGGGCHDCYTNPVLCYWLSQEQRTLYRPFKLWHNFH